jgi:hypothetical protein
VEKRVITANLEKKDVDISSVLGVARLFYDECATDGWLAELLETGPERAAGAAVG